MNKIEKILKLQMKMGYWPGFTMAMYPSQFAYDEMNVDFENIWKDREEVNLYYHIPFCKSLCPYCGFFTVAMNDMDYIAKYIDKINHQVKTYFSYFNKTGVIKSICFGGGTPNHAPIELYDKVFNTLHGLNVKLDKQLEPSMEVSPELLTESYIRGLSRVGIKRLSLGVQSLNLDIRSAINRENNYNLLSLVDIMRRNNMNINIDVINGINGQTPQMFMDTLERLMEFKPETLSIYPMAGKDSSMFKVDQNTMTNSEKYELFRVFYDYLLEQGYDCESNVKFVLRDQPSTHQQKLYEYQGVDTMGVGCAARSYNKNMHYSVEHRFNSKQRRQLLEEFMAKDFRELKYYGISMDEYERKSRFAIYGLFAGKLCMSQYKGLFGTELTEDFPEQLEALFHLGLIEEKEDNALALTKEGIVYTDIICVLFWSSKVARKYKNNIDKNK